MKRVLELDSNHADALNYVGYTYAEQGIKLDQALEMIQKALTLKPNNAYIIDSLGWVYYQKQMYDKALEYLEKAASLAPNDPTIAEHVGDTHLKLKNFKKSIDMYNKALALDHLEKEKIKEKIKEAERMLKKNK